MIDLKKFCEESAKAWIEKYGPEMRRREEKRMTAIRFLLNGGRIKLPTQEVQPDQVVEAHRGQREGRTRQEGD